MPPYHQLEGFESIAPPHVITDASSILLAPDTSVIKVDSFDGIDGLFSDPRIIEAMQNVKNRLDRSTTLADEQEPLILIPDYTTEYSGIDKGEVTIEMDDSVDARIAMYIAIVGTREIHSTGSKHDGSWEAPDDSELFQFDENLKAGVLRLTLPVDHQSFRSRYERGYARYLQGLSNAGKYSDEISNRQLIMAHLVEFMPNQRSEFGLVYRQDFGAYGERREAALEYEAELIARGMDYRRFSGITSTSYVTCYKPSGVKFKEHYRIEVFDDENYYDVANLVHGAFLMGIFASVETNTRLGTVVLMNKFDTSREELLRLGREHLKRVEDIATESTQSTSGLRAEEAQRKIEAIVDFAA